MQDLEQLAKIFIEGEWQYNATDKSLKKSFASNKELTELGLVDEDGFLDAKLKTAIMNALGINILNGDVLGPFGDSDIFSGDMVEEELFYNIELFNVTESVIRALQDIANVVINNEIQ